MPKKVKRVSRVRALTKKDQKLAEEMSTNLGYLLAKYTWLEVYHGAWRKMANRMCGEVEARCLIISEKKDKAYMLLEQDGRNMCVGRG